MEISKKTIDTYITRLSGISNTIKSIYNKLDSCFNNPEETEKLQEYLSLATKTEDNILNEIGKEIFENDQFLDRFSYLVLRSDLEHKEEINDRILYYISQKIYLNPFLSTDLNPQANQEENYTSIRNQAVMDYFKSVLHYIDIELKKDSPKEKEKLTKAKNSLLYKYKMIDVLMKDERNDKIDGRNRCIIFNQDEELIAYAYTEYSYAVLNYCFHSILSKNENTLEQIQFKSALNILNKEEIMEVARSFQNAINNDPSYRELCRNNPNKDVILEIIKEFIQKHIDEDDNKAEKK